MKLINRIINRIKIELTNFKHRNRVINDYNVNAEFYKTLIKEVRVIDQKYQLSDSTWDNYRKEFRRAILEDDISDFLNWDVIKETMFYEPGKLQYEVVKNNKKLLKSIKESEVGNPKPYWLDSSTSGNAVNHAYSLSKLLEKCHVSDFNNIVDLGGGYGSMCRLFRNYGFTKKYTIFDFPEMCALQRYYLNSVGGGENTVLTDDIKSLSDDNSITLLIATWSLSEMSLEMRKKLGDIKFDYCLIGFRSEFDGVDNMEYFEKFKKTYPNINFYIEQAQNIKNNFYLIGVKK
jgi:putative sugar O-methyltransferase